MSECNELNPSQEIHCALPQGHELWHQHEGLSWGPDTWTHCLTCRIPLEPSIRSNHPVMACPQCGNYIQNLNNLTAAEVKGLFAQAGLGVDPDSKLHTQNTLGAPRD